MADKPKLTIFTPAWNRADLLPRLFESIANQVDAVGAVEWLVVDDGSTDETPEVLGGFLQRRPDLLRVLRVENGGKHRAINRAAREARADWILLVDSDDAVADGAIEQILRSVEENDADERVGLIRGLKRFPELQKAHSFQVPENPCHHWQWVSHQKAFDSVEVIRRSALLRHLFPEHPGEKFMAEGWLWNNLDREYLVRFVNLPWIDCWYQAGGLSSSSVRIRARSPLGAMDVYSSISSSPASWQLRSRASINWWRYWFHAKAANRTGESAAKTTPRRFAPLGWLLYRRDVARLGGES